MTRLLAGLRFTLKPAGEPERHTASGNGTHVQVRSGAMIGIPVASNGGFAPRPSSVGVAGAAASICPASSTPASSSLPGAPAALLPAATDPLVPAAVAPALGMPVARAPLA